MLMFGAKKVRPACPWLAKALASVAMTLAIARTRGLRESCDVAIHSELVRYAPDNALGKSHFSVSGFP